MGAGVGGRKAGEEKEEAGSRRPRISWLLRVYVCAKENNFYANDSKNVDLESEISWRCSYNPKLH
jgi:hypothetical protein